jgi:glycosyltransferase involved in cell wall biosynthesis
MAPDVTFEVAGVPNPPGAYADALMEIGNSLPNVHMLGRVEREHIPNLYRGAVCLCCTSIHEGFPNTFLEAWSQGLPVVSTFDPDGLIAERQLGGVGETAEDILAAIRRLMQSPEEWLAASRRGHAYYTENHLPANVVPRFEVLFREMVGQAHHAGSDTAAPEHDNAGVAAVTSVAPFGAPEGGYHATKEM